MSGREYYTDAKAIPATAQNVYYDFPVSSRGILVVSPLLNITIKTKSGEEVTVPDVTGSPNTNATILPYDVSSIKANVSGGIPANRVYQLF